MISRFLVSIAYALFKAQCYQSKAIFSVYVLKWVAGMSIVYKFNMKNANYTLQRPPLSCWKWLCFRPKQILIYYSTAHYKVRDLKVSWHGIRL